MKKCWVRVDVQTAYRSHEYKWKKGSLVEYDEDSNLYKVKYKNDGPKIRDFEKKNYTTDKPDELKFKMDEPAKRSWPYKTVFFLLYVIVITLFFMYGGFPPLVGMVTYPFSWIVLITGFNLIHRVFEAEVRQEKILKILENEYDN